MPGEKILKRLDRIEEIILARINRYRRLVKEGSQDESEEHRVWMEDMIKAYAKGRKGLDICAGDFPIIEAEGVDSADDVLGLYWRSSGDALTFCESNSIDYIACNYLESFPDTLKALIEWHRVLKDEGILILVTQNADAYVDPIGPLGNKKRCHCFTPKTIWNYLIRSGFSIVSRTLEGDVIHVIAKKG